MTSPPITARISLKLFRLPDIRLSHTGEILSGNTKFLKKISLEKDV